VIYQLAKIWLYLNSDASNFNCHHPNGYQPLSLLKSLSRNYLLYGTSKSFSAALERKALKDLHMIQ